jgi:hypothetical protein
MVLLAPIVTRFGAALGRRFSTVLLMPVVTRYSRR